MNFSRDPSETFLLRLLPLALLLVVGCGVASAQTPTPTPPADDEPDFIVPARPTWGV
jgi:hypothetical protein